MKVCPKCGSQKQDFEKFCDQCGSLLEVKNDVPMAVGATVYVSPLPDENEVAAQAPAQPIAQPAPAPAPAPAPVAPQAPAPAPAAPQFQSPAQAPQPYAQPAPQYQAPQQPQMTQPQQQPVQQPVQQQFQQAAPQQYGVPAYPVYAQQPQQRPQAPVQPQPQYQQPQQRPQAPAQPQQQYQQPYAAPLPTPYQQYSPSAMTKKKGVDVLAIIACVLAIFIFVVPFLKTYQAKAGKRTGNSQSQYDVTKQVIEALDEKDSSSYETQIKVFVLSFAGLIITALILLIPSFIYSCKGNRPKAWKFILLTSIFALLANASYMYAMKCDEDLMNVYSNSRVYKLEPNALFIILLVFIVALMVTSIVKMSLSKKQPA